MMSEFEKGARKLHRFSKRMSEKPKETERKKIEITPEMLKEGKEWAKRHQERIRLSVESRGNALKNKQKQ